MASTFADRDLLPDSVKPINYDISLYDIELGGEWSYEGTVGILARVTESTKELVLNSIDLEIHGAEVSDAEKTQETIKSTAISYDTKAQRATLTFSQNLAVSDTTLIIIKFKGQINDGMHGFYRSKYKIPNTTDDELHHMLSTQFEACDARRAFPCFDEPNLKATFDVQIEIPEGQVALSNLPQKKVTKSKNGRQVVAFEQTPRMSTYLLAWAVGDFEYAEAFTERKYNGKQLPVRVYTTKGLKGQATWALEHATKIIDYFSDIFGIEYPLPKSDLLAVHEFVSGIPSSV